MAHVNLTLEIPGKDIADLRAMLDYGALAAGRHPSVPLFRKVLALFKGVLVGAYRGYIRTTLCTARASGTFTGTAAGVAPNDTITIAGTTLTNKASPASEDEFADAATNALLAASLAAAINAHSVLSKIVFAVVTTAADGVVTVYSKYPGTIGNLITLAESGGYSVSGANMTGGAGDEMDEFQKGYDPATALAG